MARWGMSSIVVLLPEELSTRFNGCPLKMIGHRPEISLIRGNGWSGRKHLQRKRIKLPATSCPSGHYISIPLGVNNCTIGARTQTRD
ncbi:hypothetical protein RIR_jg36050.t1 [Rhizophagus irregularis DAOM 181602=DAOM 197198]|nr:hypothetical protein RIR_jg36050.t1 [Rhizophagus irregularis DAOM 181602=DAOM 197198]